MPAKQARRNPRSSGQPVRQARTNPTATPPNSTNDRIRVHLWPRRGLSRVEEDALASNLDRLRGEQHWTWVGTALTGDMCTEAEFTEGDLIDHLCALRTLVDLVRIDLSQPYPTDCCPTAWLRVRRNHPDLPSPCTLYRDRLLAAEVVVGALGGFAPDIGGKAPPEHD